MKKAIYIFLIFITIASGQNKKNNPAMVNTTLKEANKSNSAIMDSNLKIPKGYSKRKLIKPQLICGTDDYRSIPEAENYDYEFYKKDNRVYCKGKLTNINGNGFKKMGYGYYKNNTNVYYYTRELGLQRIIGIDLNSSRISNSFLVDKNQFYIRDTKVIGSQDLEFVSNYIGYKEAIFRNGIFNDIYVNYYLIKNNKGYWIVRASSNISYNFLGKIYDHNWDIVFEEDNLGDTTEDNQVYYSDIVEVHPLYPGGFEKMYEFLGKNYVVPNEFAGETTCPGKIYVKFVVEKDGSLSDIKILRDIGYGTGKELIRILPLLPKWIPAELNGRKVRCQYTIPFSIPVQLN
jgi:hypothetical protein